MKRRTVAALLAGLSLMSVAVHATAAEYDTFSSTPATWYFASPWGDLSDEPSGLGASRTNPGVVYWENEAPRNGRGMVYAVDRQGLQRAYSFSPTGPDRPTGGSYDFEDMAVGPCNGPGSGNCVWVGDIGRVSADFSAAGKNTFWFYRMPEPDLAAVPSGSELPVTGRLPFTLPAAITGEAAYPGGVGSSYDMEAMMVHPTSGEVFVVTKGQNTAGLIRILRYPGPLTPGVSKELEVVKTYQMPRASNWTPSNTASRGTHEVTGADVHPDGRRFILRTYSRIWEFRGTDWSDALASTTPVQLPKAGGTLEVQGEAVAYAPDGSGYFTLGEASSTITRSLVSFWATSPPTSGNALPVASFTSSTSGLVVTVDGSGSSDPDGAIAAHSWDFGDGGPTATGPVATRTFSAAGTYTVTLTVTDTSGATASISRSVTVTAPGGTLAADTFTRTLAGGWGTADTGGKYSHSGGAANFAVNGATGTITVAPGTGRRSLLPAVSATDTDLTATIGHSGALSGGGLYSSVMPRVMADSSSYRSKIHISATGTARVRLVRTTSAGAETTLATAASTLTGASSSRNITIRTQATGTSPTTLRAKIWFEGTPEPTGWAVQATDATSALQAPGAVGLYTYQSSSATSSVTVSTDNLRAVALQ